MVMILAIKWRYDSLRGILIISGEGEMDNFDLISPLQRGDLHTSSAPWSSLNIKKIYIEYGVSSIGDYAFSGLFFLNSIYIYLTVLLKLEMDLF